MSRKTDQVQLTYPGVGPFFVDTSNHEAAKDELRKFKEMYPHDRFTISESEIVALIASKFQREKK